MSKNTVISAEICDRSLAVVRRAAVVAVLFVAINIGSGADAAVTQILDATGDGANVFGMPSGVATDSTGNVFAVGWGSDNVFKIIPDGDVTEIINRAVDGPNELIAPLGIATDPAGNVFVTGQGSNNVFRITPTGIITEIINGTGTGEPRVLVVQNS